MCPYLILSRCLLIVIVADKCSVPCNLPLLIHSAASVPIYSGYLSNPKLVASSAACTCGGAAGNVNGNLDACLAAIRSTGLFMPVCVDTRHNESVHVCDRL